MSGLNYCHYQWLLSFVEGAGCHVLVNLCPLRTAGSGCVLAWSHCTEILLPRTLTQPQPTHVGGSGTSCWVFQGFPGLQYVAKVRPRDWNAGPDLFSSYWKDVDKTPGRDACKVLTGQHGESQPRTKLSFQSSPLSHPVAWAGFLWGQDHLH